MDLLSDEYLPQNLEVASYLSPYAVDFAQRRYLGSCSVLLELVRAILFAFELRDFSPSAV